MIKNRLIKYLLLTVLSIYTVTHIVQIFFTGVDLDQLSILIFIVMIIALYKENKKLYSLSFVMMGALCILTLPQLASLSAVPIFLIAMYFYSKPIMLSTIFSTIVSSYVIYYYWSNSTNYINLIEGIIGNTAFLIFFYLIFIRQPSDITHLARITPLDARQLIILKYLSRDISRKEMPDKVPERELWKHDIDNFTFDIINAEISKIKKVLDLKSEFALGIWYSEKCEISRNTSKT